MLAHSYSDIFMCISEKKSMYKSNVIGYISLTMNKRKHFLYAYINPFIQRIIYLRIPSTPIWDSKIVELVFRCQGHKLFSLGSRIFFLCGQKENGGLVKWIVEQRIGHISAFQIFRSRSSAVVLQSSSLKSARRREKWWISRRQTKLFIAPDLPTGRKWEMQWMWYCGRSGGDGH